MNRSWQKSQSHRSVTLPPDLDPGRCYEALRSRDPRFDGRFFAGVTTTGIYCRPVCPARTPKRENVRFFACAAAAQAAGFRPCRRCRPETSPGTPAWIGSSAVVSRALRLISNGGLDDARITDLADRLGIGDRQLRRLFEKHLGASPTEVARARRVHFACRLIDETHLPMAEVAFAAGFKSIRDFNHEIRATFGRCPSDLRRRGDSAVPANGRALTVRLPYRPPLDWAAMVAFLRPRVTPGVEIVENGFYRRARRVSGGGSGSAPGARQRKEAGLGRRGHAHGGSMETVARLCRDGPLDLRRALAFGGSCMMLEIAKISSPLGRLTLAVHGGRLCALSAEEHWPRMRKALEKRFGTLELRRAEDPAGVVTSLRAYFCGSVEALGKIPVDPGGTPFQRSVWFALRNVKAGETSAYGDVARRIGCFKAARAVGAASGANPIWIVIPCHRLIGANGALGGYAGGIARKRWLLRHEGAIS